uniref:Protein AF1q n=2 Tax=Paramormyrops kingsleyae TaxID=1676925 RepID=A0A3B3R406_9TELE
VLEDANNQYDSFLFWRQPIPELDLSELEGLGLIDSSSMKDSKLGKKGSQKKVQEWEEDEEAELSEYNSFNYWREPIASIDLLDFNLLL